MFIADTFELLFLVFNEDRAMQLAASSEASRDSWMEALLNASYECLQVQLQSLRREIVTKTGRDPLEPVTRGSSKSTPRTGDLE